MPAGDEGAIRVTLDLPPGTPIGATAAVSEQAERLIREIPDVEAMLTTAGGTGGQFAAGGGANSAEILVTLRDDSRPTDQVVREVRSALAGIPDAEITAIAIDPSGGPGGGQAPIQLLISGPDYAELEETGRRVARELAAAPQLSDVDYTLEAPRTELVFRPDRAALADHGLTAGQIGQVVRASIEGTIAGVFRGEARRERDIRVRLDQGARQHTTQVRELQIRTANGNVSLSALGEIAEVPTPTAIQRVDRVRTVQIDAQIGAGTLTDAIAAVESRMEAQPLPPGYTWRITGQAEAFGEALGTVLVALFLAVTLTYIVLAMILESFVHPFTIMLTLPLGAVGAMLGLFLWGASINIFSMMALIMLVGIVVNNAILILDYAGQLRRQGMDITGALLKAAPARLRPIIMTNIAIIVALIPQALGTGAGAVFRVPMAVVTMGGVALAAVFTLFLVPVIYTKLDWLSATVRTRVWGQSDEATAGAPGIPTS
jgi:hydrophobic/amphiphilic exporter-1 (mainly G- bacteria), HAE1 family